MADDNIQTKAADTSSSFSISKSDLEILQFHLDEEKLAFEKKKFEAEQTQREKELAKLDEEILEYRRPLWRKASSIGAIATIVVAIVAGILTFGTDIFKSNIRRLIADRSTLKKTVKTLSTEEAKLNKENLGLETQRADLLQEQKSLLDQRDELFKNTNALQIRERQLQRSVVLAPIKTRLELLEPAPAIETFLTIPNGPDDASIQALIDIAKSHRNDPEISDLFSKAFDEARQPTTKAALSLVLFRVTNDSQWKAKLIQLVIDNIGRSGVFFRLNSLSYFLHLLNSPDTLTSDDKIRALKSMFSKLESDLNASNFPLNKNDSSELAELKKENIRLAIESSVSDICSLAKWDKLSTETFRDPWITCRNQLLIEQRNAPSTFESERTDGELYFFSQQIYAVETLRVAVKLGIGGFADGERVNTGYFGLGDEKCPLAEASFPLCIDWSKHRKPEEPTYFRLWRDSLPEYSAWLVNNKEVVSVLTDADPSALRKIRNETM